MGAPKATLKVVSPQAERTQHSGNAADKLVLFAKLYDVAPDGTQTLVHRLVAPVRVPDVTRSFTVTLPGIVHRYEQGHRLRFVVAASDDAYFGNRGIKPVTVVSGRGRRGCWSCRWWAAESPEGWRPDRGRGASGSPWSHEPEDIRERQWRRMGRSSAVTPARIVVLLLAVLALIFIFENTGQTKIRLLIPEVTMPLWTALLATGLIGALCGAYFMKRRS